MAKVAWTARALGDLRSIHGYIQTDSPHYAAAQMERILAAAGNLAEFPNLGRTLPEFPLLPYREILTGNYRILYRMQADTVYIIAVLHGRRLLSRVPE